MSFSFSGDGNRQQIIDALEAEHVLVEPLDRAGDGIPDLLVGFRRRLALLEVKNPDTENIRRPTKALRKKQREFFAKWRGYPVFIVFTPQQALRAIGVRR